MQSPFRNLIRTDYLSDHYPVNAIPKTPMAFIWHFICLTKWPFIIFTIINSVSSALTVLGFYYVEVIIDTFRAVEGGGEDTWNSLWPHLVGFIGLYLILQPLTARIAMAMFADMRPNFMNLIRRHLSLYMYQHGYRYFQNEFAGRVSSKVLETPYAAMNFVFSVIMGFGYAFFTTLTVIVLFAMTGQVFFLITVGWLVIYILLLCIFTPQIVNLTKISHDKVSIVRGRYVDTLTNISTVKLFGRQKYEDQRFTDALIETSAAGANAWHKVNHMQIWLEILSVLFVAVAFYFAIEGWISGAITIGSVAMILPLVLRLMDTSWWLSDVIFGLFDNYGQVKEGIEAIFSRNIEPERQTKSLKVTQGVIELKNVDFIYDDKPVFENLNLRIEAGQKVGIVGPSGAGKTTLMNMLLRLYDYSGGQVLIDDQDISEVTRNSLRQSIAIIPQHTDMLHRSIADNIRYGDLDATDEDVIKAAEQAHAHGFILDLQDHEGNRAYQAKAGERGVKLSGGQRQRVAIARAILKDAPILFLDEATSALDSESELLIQDSLKDLMVGKTVLAIAHRLSTIAHLDRLIVMKNGKIVEDGTHQELLAKGGTYANLWAMQSGGFLGEK